MKKCNGRNKKFMKSNYRSKKRYIVYFTTGAEFQIIIIEKKNTSQIMD
jgi:hypothetical protein